MYKGDEDGPEFGFCDIWIWDSDDCPPECRIFDGNCFECNAQDHCGYCADTLVCLQGEKSGPLDISYQLLLAEDESLTCEVWEFTVDDCTGGPVDCSLYTECDTCVAQEECAYCSIDRQCHAIADGIPPICNVSGAWNQDSCGCNTIFDCVDCIAEDLCGWCLTGDSPGCFEGNLTHPFDYFCPPIDQSDNINISSWQFDDDSYCDFGFSFSPVGWYFSDNGAKIYGTFPEATNRANQISIFDCGELFDEATVATFGEKNGSATCFWQNDELLVIRLGWAFSIRPNDTVTIKADTIAPKGQNSTGSPSLSPTVIYPFHPDSPVVAIRGPLYVTLLDEVTLDASLSYVTGLQDFEGGYIWEVLEGPDNPPGSLDDFKAFIDTQRNFSITFNVSDYCVPGLSYTLRLNITNWLGLTASDIYTFGVVTSSQVSVVLGTASTIRTHRKNALSLKVAVTRPALCDELDLSSNTTVIPEVCANSEFQFAWIRAYGPVFALDLKTRLTAQLFIPANTLIGGEEYLFTVTATLNNSLNIVGRATVRLIVEVDPIRARIHSGNRIISRFDTLSLDASASNDPNGLDGNLTFFWSCIGEGRFPECPANRIFAQPQFQTSIVNLPPGSLLPGNYLFSVKVRKLGLVSTDTVNIKVVWEDVPTVTLKLLDTNPPLEHPLAHQRIRFTGCVKSPSGLPLNPTGYEYSIVMGDDILSGNRLPVWPSTPLPGQNEICTILEIRQRNVVITPGAEYTLRLSARHLALADSPVDNVEGWAEFTFQTEDAPWGGRCWVDPPSASQDTIFTLQCLGYEDNKDDFPLTYEFAFLTPALGTPWWYNTGGVPNNQHQTLFLYFSSIPSWRTVVKVVDYVGAVDPSLVQFVADVVVTPSTTRNSRGTTDFIDVATEDFHDPDGIIQVSFRDKDTNTLFLALLGLMISMNQPFVDESWNINPFEDERELALRIDIMELLLHPDTSTDPTPESTLNQLSLLLELVGGANRELISESDAPRVTEQELLVNDPVANLGRSVIRSLRLLTFQGRLNNLLYVEYAFMSVSNLISFWLPMLDSSDGFDFSLEVASLIDEVSASLSLYLTPGTGLETIPGGTQFDFLISSEWLTQIPDEVEDVDNNVTLELDSTVVSEAITAQSPNTPSVGITLMTMRTDLYSWLPTDEIISPNVRFSFIYGDEEFLFDEESVREVESRAIDPPITARLPVILDNTDLNLTSILDTYGFVCQYWNNDAVGWITACVASFDNATQSLVCECSELESEQLTVRVKTVDGLPVGPGPLGEPLPDGVLLDNSSDNSTAWVLLILVVVVAIGVCLILLLGIFTWRGKAEPQEEYEPLPTKLLEEVEIESAEAESSESESEEPPRELNLSAELSSDVSEVLLYPKLDEKGRIVYAEHDGSMGALVPLTLLPLVPLTPVPLPPDILAQTPLFLRDPPELPALTPPTLAPMILIK
eukprot:CAMPEP_0174261070 /NCGR_PEP_ID=MMETSP0439-20130205/11214_1 /TAXON_ID=0 /ORGANISM="Stereomyxa ramosa, Strain Chinc5" /LENGTH=1445 /DNA_ID=CAMNT_0015345487 /DNA_START=218 /DNA_END=4557 /DNA_ORIENTATION=-